MGGCLREERNGERRHDNVGKKVMAVSEGSEAIFVDGEEREETDSWLWLKVVLSVGLLSTDYPSFMI